MATTEVKIPSPGESISEVEIASWFVETGDYVEKDQEIGEIESEKGLRLGVYDWIYANCSICGKSAHINQEDIFDDKLICWDCQQKRGMTDE